MDAIIDISRRHGIKVIEDCAQALGASYKGKKVCTFGDVGCISFFPSKNLGAFGEGGMVVTKRDDLAERVKKLRVHGMGGTAYLHELVGINSRLDTIQAAILGVKYAYLDQWNAARKKAAERYTAMLQGTPVVPPYVLPHVDHIFHQYTLRVPRRDELAAYLKQREIPHAIYYPVPLHLQQAFAMAGNKKGDFPATESATAEVLSLPMHTELTDEQLTYITDSIKGFYAKH